MQTWVMILVNGLLLGLFGYLLTRKDLLTVFSGGRAWLTWLAVAVITLMDEFTSVFYAPAEAYRFLGISAIFFIAITSIIIRFYCTRLVEIAEVLEEHKLIGGGVYSFSYLVLGPVISFVAVASIMVDYVLTACLSAVSAVENVCSFMTMTHPVKMAIVLAIIWAVAGLNIMGIRENARLTFLIFIVASIIMVNLLTLGGFSLDQHSFERMGQSVTSSMALVATKDWIYNFDHFIAAIASCILAYSGVESVLQTAGLVRSWREIRRAYFFLALTVGLVTPIMAAMALSAPIDFKAHEGDLITFFATMVGGMPLGVAVAFLASITLTMAINTAFVASSELLERVAERYHFHWLVGLNRRNSLYRIHLISAGFFSLIIFITAGQQDILADMYALGLIASFGINLGGLLIHRYFHGAKDVTYPTNRLFTLVLWVIMVGCFVFLAIRKPHGTLLWAVVTTVVLGLGLLVSRRRAPEIKERGKSDNFMDMILRLAESDDQEVHIFFMRPREQDLLNPQANQVFVSFYVPRHQAPARLASNHYRFAHRGQGLFASMVALLKLVQYELIHRTVKVHFGWPMSSWLDRLSIGVMILNLMRLPRLFPNFHFTLDYPGKMLGAAPAADLAPRPQGAHGTHEPIANHP
ncbi:MAG: APC family permease [Pseudomonadota bacterium]